MTDDEALDFLATHKGAHFVLEGHPGDFILRIRKETEADGSAGLSIRMGYLAHPDVLVLGVLPEAGLDQAVTHAQLVKALKQAIYHLSRHVVAYVDADGDSSN